MRANEGGFEKIFAGLALAKRGDNNNDMNSLQDAYDFVDQGIAEVIRIQARNNSNIVTLNSEEQNINSLKTYWKGLRDDIANTDVVTVSSQVAIDQGILQSTFQAFAKITSLRLIDFLR